MKEKLGIRFLTQLIAYCFLIFVLSHGYFFEISLLTFLYIFVLALISTIFLECFDRLFVKMINYERWIVGIGILLQMLIYYIGTYYLFIVIGYLFIIMVKDMYRIGNMQKSLKNFQQEYE